MRRVSSFLYAIFLAIAAIFLLLAHDSASITWTASRSESIAVRRIFVAREEDSLRMKTTANIIRSSRKQPCHPCAIRGPIVINLSKSSSAVKESDKGAYNNNGSGVKNAISMGLPLFFKFVIVMIVKFVKDLVIYPFLLMRNLFRISLRRSSSKADINHPPTKNDSTNEEKKISAEEDLELTIKVIMGGPGTQF